MFFLVFFHGVAASTLTLPAIGGAGFTTVFDALLLVTLPFDNTTTDRT
jgi:hypothetical protein